MRDGEYSPLRPSTGAAASRKARSYEYRRGYCPNGAQCSARRLRPRAPVHDAVVQERAHLGQESRRQSGRCRRRQRSSGWGRAISQPGERTIDFPASAARGAHGVSTARSVVARTPSRFSASTSASSDVKALTESPRPRCACARWRTRDGSGWLCYAMTPDRHRRA
jgi:hypothetical protein